ncbi:uncharacterized protein LY89DRAFT_710862 [Mollisia scopiformis]|uniref:Ubiquitin-like domain-containing protein n=1 Tax=Mollisia scopiformis TaxID=149040 RepID=A0A132BCB7_MOLSC|nr:uncharacterized protein LY89DRAFT_710862 [Mollisia scopiformis]KUJ10036.1 hypothetical protein LY89DRAFT_710862 [Mollisia scopiformis]
MSFGFSVGDFLAVGTLVADITKSLREAGGSKSEYQELLRELESLNHALKHLDRLPKNAASANLESIKKTADKVLWAFGEKDDIRKLQSYLSIHIGTINMLLAEYGLEKMELVYEKGELERLHIRERLENTKSLMQWIKDSVVAQTAAVHNANSMLTKLFAMVSGEIGSSMKSLGEMVAKVCVSTQQIYGVVLEIRESLATPDAKWTFFQAPLIVEDALGLKFPVPSEYDFGLLNAIIKHRFLDGPGSVEVQTDNYELFSAKNSQVVISENVRLLPGASIIMAILLYKPASKVYTDETCPMPRCGSTLTTAAPGGGRICKRCNVWFDQSSKKRKLDLFLYDIDIRDGATSKDLSKSNNPGGRTKSASDSEESLDFFRNVKLAEEILQELNPVIIPADDKPIRDGRGPAEFNDAISFVNKIKSRYQDKPEIYREFLDILQTYQRESLPIQEVYALLTDLFAAAPDLLEDFKMFLPESAEQARLPAQQNPPNLERYEVDEMVEQLSQVGDRARKRLRRERDYDNVENDPDYENDGDGEKEYDSEDDDDEEVLKGRTGKVVKWIPTVVPCDAGDSSFGM